MNKKLNKSVLLVFAFVIMLVSLVACNQTNPSTAPASPAKAEITAFAAANSKAVMEEAGSTFEAKTKIKVIFNFGGSGTLLSQMKLSRSGDLFIPASPDYIAKATTENVIYPESEVKLAYLIPAILVQKGNPKNIKTLADLAGPVLKIALPDPQTVTAGHYAYEILDFNGMLSGVGKNVITYSENYDKMASLVILKSVDAAIGWDILALQQPEKLDVVYLQADQLPRISYMSGAISTYTKDRQISQRFLEFLVSAEGQGIFKKNGYCTSESEARKFSPQAKIGGEYKLPSDYRPLVK